MNKRMKTHTFVFAFLLMLATSVGFAQKKIQIKVNSISKEDPFVYFTLPVEGNFFESNIVSKALNTNQQVILDTTLFTEPSVIRVTSDFKQVYLIVQPGDKVEINFEGKVPKILGANAEGQMLYNEIYSDNTRSRFKILDSGPTAKQRWNTCDSLRNLDLAQFKSLLKNKKVNKKFYEFMSHESDMYYRLLFSTNMFFSLKNYIYGSEAGNNTPPDPEFITTWESIYKDVNTNPNWMKSKFFNANMYRLASLLELQHKEMDRNKREVYAIAVINFLKLKLKGKALEYGWAEMINLGLENNENEKVWIENWASFKETFPNSALIPLLTPGIDRVVKYQAGLAQRPSDVHLLDDYASINTLEELGQKLKGKVSYVDLWATWCGPCKQELQYSIKLHDEIEKLEVQPVYVSLDIESAETKWREMMNGFPLKGINLRANDKLSNDFRDKLPNFAGIPRYLIFDKEGKIVNLDAKRPSEGRLLLEQLKVVVEKK